MRNFSRSSAAADLVGGRQPAGRRRGVAGSSTYTGTSSSSAVAAGDHPARVAGQVVGVAQRDLDAGQVAARACAHSPTGPASWPAPPVTTRQRPPKPRTSGRSVSAQHEAADQPAASSAGGAVRRGRLGERRVARREDRGVVDEPAHASSRRHARTNVARHGVLPSSGRRPAEAAHPAPRPRRQALLRGADGGGGLLLGLLAALPPRRSVGDRRQRGVGAARPDPHAQPPAQAAPPQAARRSPRRGSDAVTGRRLVLGNGDVRIGYVVTGATRRRTTATPSATSASTSRPAAAPSRRCFGVLPLPQGDYVLIPRATTHRWVPAEPSRLYAIEANSHIAPPKRYLSRYGQLLEHAPYCERDLHGPAEPFAGRGRRTSRCSSSTGTAPASSAPG